MAKFAIDGSSPFKIEDYSVWSVVNEDKQMICTFYGPMSLICAATACKALNEGTFLRMPEARDMVEG